jgi:hypothetical protein
MQVSNIITRPTTKGPTNSPYYIGKLGYFSKSKFRLFVFVKAVFTRSILHKIKVTLILKN